MPHLAERGSLATLSWGLFLVLALSTLFVAMGFPVEPVLLLGAAAALLFAFRYIYLTLYLGIALVPFLGIIVAVPTGSLAIGQRAFGGVIDVSLGEVVLFFVLMSWGLRLIFLWWQRRDRNWRPRLPLIGTYAALFVAHLASVFSPLDPDPLPTLKFAFRPVLYDYLAFIALPVNLIRSRKRLVAVLGTIFVVGMFAAGVGFLSIFFPSSGGGIGRAYPVALFGVNALGENQNELADFLIFTVPFSLALAILVKDPRARRLLQAGALFQLLIALLTFTRTTWIVFSLESVFLVITIWREAFKKYLSTLLVCAVLLLPLGIAMATYSVSETAQSSNSTRLMLSEIAYDLFTSSPWIGAGAGSFLDRVGSTSVFLTEYGDPLDSHGFIQKLGAETGLFGLLAFGAIVIQFCWLMRKGIWNIQVPVFRQAFFLLIAGAGGSMAYQMFNTDYWTGKLWLPIGLTLAALNVFWTEPKPDGVFPEPFPAAVTHDILEA